MNRLFIISITLVLSSSLLCFGQETNHVRISVERFEELLEAAGASPTPTPTPEQLPPIEYSLSSSSYVVEVKEKYASISCTVEMKILSKEWVKIPLITTDSAINKVHLDGKLSSLHRENNRYWLHVKSEGQHRLEIFYSTPVERLIGGYRIQFSTPTTISGNMKVTIPGQWWATNVIPSEGITLTHNGEQTSIEAVLVSTDRVQIIWGEQKEEQYTYTSGIYSVNVEEKGVFIKAKYKLEIDSDQPIKVPVVSNKYGLISIRIDDQEPAIILVDDMYGITLQGHSKHLIEAEFAANVDRTEGQPSLQLKIPQSPISQFTLTVPGKRAVSVTPVVPIKENANDKVTTITVNFPQTDIVKFIWTDSRPVPEQMARMNGEGYYAVLAEEGVLRINASYDFDIISGKTHDISLFLPENVVVYQVNGEGITDWRTFTKEKKRFLNVYFDQPRHGKYQLYITYDQLIPKSKNQDIAGEIQIPLIQPEPVHRYQGTVLLLSGETLEFVPKQMEGFIPVGAEVIPADIKSKLKQKLAYGYKYVGIPSSLLVKLEKPQKDEAKFDSTVNTLHTIDEGILRSRSSIDITVKAGGLKEIEFAFNKETTILDLVSPSLLKFTEAMKNDQKIVTVQFTQALEGTFRVDISFETLLDPKLTSVPIHAVDTLKAEVERGFVGIESVTTVEVVTQKSEDIQEIDTKELPLWLTERTNRPILLAYKYSHLPNNLVVRITRHETVAAIEARITSANNVTTFLKDGNVLTEITYTIINYTKQFLRIEMPENARLWHSEISGNQVKTAKDKDGRLILPLPRSREPITCKIKYSQKKPEMGYFGVVNIHAPKPDLFISKFQWSLTLPAYYSYFLKKSNMELSNPNGPVFHLTKELSATTDETLYFRTNYRFAKARYGFAALTIFFTLLLSWFYSRRQNNPSLLEKSVAGICLIIFIVVILWLDLSLMLIAVVIIILILLSYIMGSKKQDQAETSFHPDENSF